MAGHYETVSECPGCGAPSWGTCNASSLDCVGAGNWSGMVEREVWVEDPTPVDDVCPECGNAGGASGVPGWGECSTCGRR